LVGFTEAAKSRHLDSETILLALDTVKVIPQVVKDQLNLQGGEALWKIERLRLIGNEPMTHEKIYLPKRFVPELNQDNASGSLFKMIEDQVTIAYASQELESVLLNGKIGKLLHAQPNDPAFLAHTTSYSVEAYPILYDESFYRADKYTFHNILYRNH
jgi:Transcriptional regulators